MSRLPARIGKQLGLTVARRPWLVPLGYLAGLVLTTAAATAYPFSLVALTIFAFWIGLFFLFAGFVLLVPYGIVTLALGAWICDRWQRRSKPRRLMAGTSEGVWDDWLDIG